MIWRLISAAIIIPIVVSAMYVDLQLGEPDSLGYAGLGLVPLALLMTGMAAHELTSMIASRNRSTPKSIVITGAVITVACACVPMLWKTYPENCPVGKLGWSALGLLVSVGIAIVYEMVRFKEADRVIANLAYSVFAIVYTGFLMSFLPGLRFFGPNAVGMTALLSVLFIVKFSDAGAFFVGKMLGRNKLAPKMSPGKSIEGALGALATGCLMSVVFFQFIGPRVSGGAVNPSVGIALFYGLVIAVTGMVGDLFESIIKRDFHAKDSSSWLRGLGGILDIFDSILASAPAAYVFWVLGWMNG